MDGKFNLDPPVRGPKLMINLTWGCLLFFAVMYLGTFAIGHFFGQIIKKRVAAENIAASQKYEASKSARPANQPNSASNTSTPDKKDAVDGAKTNSVGQNLGNTGPQH